MDPEQALINERLNKLKAIRALKINPYPYKYSPTHHAEQIKNSFAGLKPEEKTKESVCIAGRLLTKRDMGKIAFATVSDQSGTIQLFAKEDLMQDNYKLFKKLDLGDFVGAKGIVFKTKSGEITIEIKELTLLSKSLRPLPEKYHGIKDPEIKFRQRYAHLATDKPARDALIIRSKIIGEIRKVLDEKNFIEVETPILQPQYGGANAKPFMTHHNVHNMDMYLRISPELYLKRLLVGGFERVYEIGRSFRNEGIDQSHNPEFTMMECYQAYADYSDMMELTEEIYERVAKNIFGTTKIKFGENIIDFKRPWRRISMVEAIKQNTNIGDISKLDDSEIKDLLKTYNIKYDKEYIRGLAIETIFDELVQDKLIQPTFITNHPKETTCLCKLDRKNPEFLERFEAFATGMELGNAYSELNDPIEQKFLLEAQAKQLRAGMEAHPMDEDFVKALETGMPPTGGLGIGIDRMTMLLTGNESIRDIIAFPTMKNVKIEHPHEGEKKKDSKKGIKV
ncbi:MAG: lysine--tRNA ligase [Nanoarchaeota archaeon]